MKQFDRIPITELLNASKEERDAHLDSSTDTQTTKQTMCSSRNVKYCEQDAQDPQNKLLVDISAKQGTLVMRVTKKPNTEDETIKWAASSPKDANFTKASEEMGTSLATTRAHEMQRFVKILRELQN